MRTQRCLKATRGTLPSELSNKFKAVFCQLDTPLGISNQAQNILGKCAWGPGRAGQCSLTIKRELYVSVRKPPLGHSPVRGMTKLILSSQLILLPLHGSLSKAEQACIIDGFTGRWQTRWLSWNVRGTRG
jgi:hypothetical protein